MTLEEPIISCKLIQSDCIKALARIKNESIDLIITSPPYNVGKEYGDINDEMSWSDWYALIEQFLKNSFRVLRSGGVIALNVLKEAKWQRNHKYNRTWSDYDPLYDSRVAGKKVVGRGRIEPVGTKVFLLMEKIGFKMRESIVWVKATNTNSHIIPIATNYQMGCDSDPFLRGCCELILLGSKHRWFHDGGTGRRGEEAVPFPDYTKDVWIIPTKRDPEHPAVFPLAIPKRLIRLFIHRDNLQELPSPIVLDPFVGSGTTLKACIDLGINFIGIELNPEYCDLIKKRYFNQQRLDSSIKYEFQDAR